MRKLFLKEPATVTALLLLQQAASSHRHGQLGLSLGFTLILRIRQVLLLLQSHTATASRMIKVVREEQGSEEKETLRLSDSICKYTGSLLSSTPLNFTSISS